MRFSTRGTKTGKDEHIVLLSRQAVSIVKQLRELSGSYDVVFPNERNTKGVMSENTVNKALRLMGYNTQEDVTGHGFRATACSSLMESGLWQEDAVERQMSHKEYKDVKRAYKHKADYLEERKLMLQWWADYLDANREIHISPSSSEGEHAVTKMTGLDAFYNESEDKIWFGNLISELARLNNENERMIAAAILSNYRLSKTKPDTLGGLGFYQFDWVSGFTTNEDFEKQCVEFLGLLAMGHEYRESPIPGEEGTFNVRKGEDFLYHDDEDDWYGSYVFRFI